MSDYAKLKAFAGAASRGEWSTSHDTIFAIQEGQTKRLMETEEGSDIAWIEHRLNLRFIAAANPAVVLGLITELTQLKAECEGLRVDAARMVKATAYVQKLCDAAGKQPSVATGYLHDILSVMSKEASNG